MSQKQNGLALRQQQQALSRPDITRNEPDNSLQAAPAVVIVPCSSAPSLELGFYGRLTGRELRRLASKRLRKQGGRQ